ncbi:303_t:CDS:2, partial [Acaulospora morrowiae]
MIGNGSPLFTRKAGKDSSDWVLEFKRFVIASRINIIAGAEGVAGRAELYDLVISCIIGEAKTWFENEIKSLKSINTNQFLEEALVVRNNAGDNNTITGANIIPVETPSPANYANADAGNSIVAPEITLGQFLYCLEYLYPMVEVQKNLLFFGQIVQGSMSILEYNAKILKLRKLAGLPESKMR